MVYTTTIRSKRQRIVTALDVGTSKICCLIAKTSPVPDWFEGKGDAVQFEVLGFDHTRAEGLKAGMIAHLDSAEHCIRSAVDAAERMAGVTVEDVHVSVTCGRLKSESFSASVALPSGAVREEDILRILAGTSGACCTRCPRATASTRMAASASPRACAASGLPSISMPSPPTRWPCAT